MEYWKPEGGQLSPTNCLTVRDGIWKPRGRPGSSKHQQFWFCVIVSYATAAFFVPLMGDKRQEKGRQETIDISRVSDQKRNAVEEGKETGDKR